MSRHDRTSFLAQLIWQGDRLGWKEETVLWVLRQGFSHGFPRSDVQAALPEAWRAAAVNIADDQIRDGTPAPRYRIGDRVRIVADRKGRHGSIYDQIWHGKDETWLYFIEHDGKRETKRFEEAIVELSQS